MPDFKKPAEKIDPRDKEALKNAGFGNPDEKFDPETEMAEVAADAAIVESVNETEGISPEPVTGGPSNKKTNKKGVAKEPQPKAKEQPQQEEAEEQEPPQAPEVELSEDPAERLRQVSEMLREEYGEDAPSLDDLVKWKQSHGDIFVLPLGERTFIYRYLKRAEWNKIQADESLQNLTDMQIDDYMFDRCVLWPSVGAVQKAVLPAGLIGAICEQIRINSMFIPPERLAQFTMKL